MAIAGRLRLRIRRRLYPSPSSPPAPPISIPRLITDSIYYYLSGLSFAETGHLSARIAINQPPFLYLAMPGLLRAPFMMMFSDFDMQLRAIQISNVVLVGVTAVMYAYVLSWIVPQKWHWLAIGFSFGFMMLNPDWGGNIFSVLADAPYAAATIAFLILSMRVLSSDRPLKEQPWGIAGCVLLFAVAFLLRFSAPVLLVYAAVFAVGRHIHGRRPIGPLLAGAATVAILLGVLVSLNWNVLNGRYLMEPVRFLIYASKVNVMMNLLASALPSQIIPRFQRLFTHDPVLSTYDVQFGSAPSRRDSGRTRHRNFRNDILWHVPGAPSVCAGDPVHSCGHARADTDDTEHGSYPHRVRADVLDFFLRRRISVARSNCSTVFSPFTPRWSRQCASDSDCGGAAFARTARGGGRIAIGETRAYSAEVTSHLATCADFWNHCPAITPFSSAHRGVWEVESDFRDRVLPPGQLVVRSSGAARHVSCARTAPLSICVGISSESNGAPADTSRSVEGFLLIQCSPGRRTTPRQGFTVFVTASD
jgi:hypothetical protein